MLVGLIVVSTLPQGLGTLCMKRLFVPFIHPVDCNVEVSQDISRSKLMYGSLLDFVPTATYQRCYDSMTSQLSLLSVVSNANKLEMLRGLDHELVRIGLGGL